MIAYGWSGEEEEELHRRQGLLQAVEAARRAGWSSSSGMSPPLATAGCWLACQRRVCAWLAGSL